MDDLILEIGKPFNPYKMFVGSFIPQWLECRPEISAGAKLIYARMYRYSGKNGVCNPRQEVLAKSVGVSDRQIRTYLKELEDNNLIASKRSGLGRSNVYVFLAHGWMTSDPDRKDSSGQERQLSSGQERKDSSDPIRNNKRIILRESKEENSEQRQSEALGILRAIYDSKIIPLHREKTGGELGDIEYQIAMKMANFISREVDGQTMQQRATILVEAYSRFCDDTYWKPKGLPMNAFVKDIQKYTQPLVKAGHVKVQSDGATYLVE